MIGLPCFEVEYIKDDENEGKDGLDGIAYMATVIGDEHDGE